MIARFNASAVAVGLSTLILTLTLNGGLVVANSKPDGKKPPTTRDGVASWYDSQSVVREGTCKSNRCFTASGKEIHELEKAGADFCAASKNYKMGTRLKVTNRHNRKSVIVEVVDRGGFGKHGRIVDLSRRSFGKIADPKIGLVKVRVEAI